MRTGITRYNCGEVTDARSLEAHITHMAEKGFSFCQVIAHTDPIIVVTQSYEAGRFGVQVPGYKVNRYSDDSGYIDIEGMADDVELTKEEMAALTDDLISVLAVHLERANNREAV